MHRSKLDYKPHVIVLGALVASYLRAFFALVNDYVPLFRVGDGTYRAEYTAAVGRAVARIDIEMQRAKAVWAVIARGVSERGHLLAAGGTDKSAVIFGKAFVFHCISILSVKSGH